mmetsp:Transcript_2716/g.6075  ORF Transcript_2716/g.6075 Transcript_2716/m.6075 type:complete len:242 (-) Transcript_2716:2501-3226(-)
MMASDRVFGVVRSNFPDRMFPTILCVACRMASRATSASSLQSLPSGNTADRCATASLSRLGHIISITRLHATSSASGAYRPALSWFWFFSCLDTANAGTSLLEPGCKSLRAGLESTAVWRLATQTRNTARRSASPPLAEAQRWSRASCATESASSIDRLILLSSEDANDRWSTTNASPRGTQLTRLRNESRRTLPHFDTQASPSLRATPINCSALSMFPPSMSAKALSRCLNTTRTPSTKR